MTTHKSTQPTQSATDEDLNGMFDVILDEVLSEKIAEKSLEEKAEYRRRNPELIRSAESLVRMLDKKR